MANIVYIATSLDGFIARRDGNLDWLTDIPNPDNSDYGFSSFMERIDGIIMGRKTFETVMSFNEWPYSKPVFVLSNTLKTIPAGFGDKAEPVSGNLNTILKSLGSKGYTNLYIDGGQTIQSFLKQDLIDEIIITRIPIILGNGIPLFVEMDMEIKLRHVNSEILPAGLVKNTYSRIL